MPIAKFPIGPLGTNSYVANITSNACVIDVGGEPEEILAYVACPRDRRSCLYLARR